MSDQSVETVEETVETVRIHEIDEIEEKPTLEQFRELLRKVEEFKRDCIDAGAAHEVYLCEVLLRLYTVLGRYQWCRQLGWTSTAAFRSAKEVGRLTSGYATFCSANCTCSSPFGGFMVPPISIPQVHLLPYPEQGQLWVHGDVNRTYSTDLFWSPSQLYPTELEPWQEQLVTGRRSRYLCRCEQSHFNFTCNFWASVVCWSNMHWCHQAPPCVEHDSMLCKHCIFTRR